MLFLTSGDLFQNYLFLPSQMTYVKLSKVKIIPWYLLITISYSNILNCPKYAFYSCFAQIRSHLESLNASSCGLFSSVQSLSHVRLFATPWIVTCQASLVHHQLPEFTQTHIHRVSDAIQPSHPLSSPFPPAPNPSQHQGLFQWVDSSHQVAKVLEFQPQHQSFQWTPRTGVL